MDETPKTPGQGRASDRTDTGALAVAKAVFKRFSDGDSDRAAAMAYYAIQSLFPGLLVVVLISLLLSSPQAVTDAVDWGVRQGVDPGVGRALNETLQDAAAKASGGVGIAAIIAAITSVSSASGWLAAAGRAIEPDPELRKQRNPVMAKVRFSLWTAALLLIVVVALAALNLGGDLADDFFDWIGVAGGAPLVWTILQPLLVLAGIVGAMLLLFQVAPDRKTQMAWKALLPGSLFAGLGWVVASGAFAFYIRNLASLGATYGAFATPIALLLWLWLSGVVVLIGGEINAELAARRAGDQSEPIKLPGADDPEIAGHPAGALPEPEDDAVLHPHAAAAAATKPT